MFVEGSRRAYEVHVWKYRFWSVQPRGPYQVKSYSSSATYDVGVLKILSTVRSISERSPASNRFSETGIDITLATELSRRGYS